jgi:hypothetical protein
MSNFIISAETFIRLSSVALKADENHDKYAEVMRAIRIENHSGVSVAVATCGKLVAVECLAECDEDGEVTVRIDDAMMTLAREEAKQDGSLTITQAPGWTVAKGTVTGRMYPLNAEVPGDWPDWRGVIPAMQPSKNNGAFAFGAEWLERLAHCSPSGVIVLPKFADLDTPVIVNDLNDTNWIGIILLGKQAGKIPAEIPDWVKI